MSKPHTKLSLIQINAIKALYSDGKTAPEIQKLTKIPHHIVRYHIERVKLSNMSVQPSSEVPNEFLKTIEDLKSKNKMLIDILLTH